MPVVPVYLIMIYNVIQALMLGFPKGSGDNCAKTNLEHILH